MFKQLQYLHLRTTNAMAATINANSSKHNNLFSKFPYVEVKAYHIKTA